MSEHDGRVTYSLIGRDSATGAIGIVIQSRWFHAGHRARGGAALLDVPT
jgi:hypothetical protein